VSTADYEIETDEEAAKRATAIDYRYHVGCDCCGLVEAVARKADAMRVMRRHMEQHELTETLSFSVFDTMYKGGGRIVFGGSIYNGIRSHGFGVGYDVNTGRAR
jgi:hypothetical protein